MTETYQPNTQDICDTERAFALMELRRVFHLTTFEYKFLEKMIVAMENKNGY